MVNPYYEHFKSFVGSGIPPDQIGEVYRSALYQRGYGIGNDFDYSSVHGLGFVDGALRLFRLALPALKSGLQYMGKSAVNAAADVATDAIMGKNVKDSVKEHVSGVAKDLFAKAPVLISEINKGVKRKRKGISLEGLEEENAPLVAVRKPKRARLKYKRGGYIPHSTVFELYPALKKIV